VILLIALCACPALAQNQELKAATESKGFSYSYLADIDVDWTAMDKVTVPQFVSWGRGRQLGMFHLMVESSSFNKNCPERADAHTTSGCDGGVMFLVDGEPLWIGKMANLGMNINIIELRPDQVSKIVSAGTLTLRIGPYVHLFDPPTYVHDFAPTSIARLRKWYQFVSQYYNLGH
jgi:hypothetical protein